MPEKKVNKSILFSLNQIQTENVKKWKKVHKCSPIHSGGAIGGQFSYIFTPTTLGTIQSIKCACGEALDLTSYDEW